MDDATGHYTTGFLFGNNYWTGSAKLCDSIYSDENEMEAEQKKKKFVPKPGLSQVKDHRIMEMNTGETVTKENPPFKPGFYVIKISVHANKITTSVSDN